MMLPKTTGAHRGCDVYLIFVLLILSP